MSSRVNVLACPWVSGSRSRVSLPQDAAARTGLGRLAKKKLDPKASSRRRSRTDFLIRPLRGTPAHPLSPKGEWFGQDEHLMSSDSDGRGRRGPQCRRS
jgi:hypothetical protein